MAEPDVTPVVSAPDVPMSALLSTVQDLWGASALGTRRRPSQVETGTVYVDFAVVPNSRTPRLLIPAASRRAARNALHRYSADLSQRKAMQRWFAATLFGAVGPRVPLAGERLYAMAQHGESIVEHLGKIMNEPVRVSLSIGTERANRKPVLQIFDHKGRSLAFAKLGGSDFTAELVRREGAALHSVGARTWEVLHAPKVLHLGQWQRHAVLVMEDLRTRPMGRLRGFERLRYAAQNELQHNFRDQAQPLVSTPLLSTLQVEANRLQDGLTSNRFRSMLGRLISHYGSTLVPVGATHGDWTAWNMAADRGRLQVWDWERFDTGVPTGIDAMHYRLSKHLQANPLSPTSILAGLRSEVPGLDETDTADHMRAVVYLCALTSRYLTGAGSVRVVSVEGKSEAMLKALEQLLGHEVADG